MERKVRIGIDVGGTFTDAVVIDNSTYEVISKMKIPTSHDSETGVAEGIVEVIEKVLTQTGTEPSDVVFIAHGTTQATNALLEGDVAKVGIIGMNSGLGGKILQNETKLKPIQLAPGKLLKYSWKYLDTDKMTDSDIEAAVNEMKNDGAEVIIASEAYAVDDTTNENRVMDIAKKQGLLTTCGSDMTQLYGIIPRTRTAAVNGSLIPKMLETANMTDDSVKKANIKAPLMIMRCDGGVMSVNEMRSRPILTMLSGLAAGVAGALMYEKLTDGIFFESGGTSTDISVIRDGKVMTKNITMDGKMLYLTALDIRTIGVAGGSMICAENKTVTDVGPRSSHIAGLPYEVFAEKITNPKIKFVSPKSGDKACYAAIDCDEGTFALTLAGAANILGYVPEGDYAHGNIETAKNAWKALGDYLGVSCEQACRNAVNIATKKVGKIVSALIKEYNLNTNVLNFVGGGGSATIVAPALAESMNIKYKTANNAPYISTIGVAMALVREQIERNVTNPTQDDIRKIRSDVIEKVTLAGAAPETVEVTVEIDSRKNILRAIATGATELHTKDMTKSKTTEELTEIAVQAFGTNKNVSVQAEAGRWTVFHKPQKMPSFLRRFSAPKYAVKVIDSEGVIRLQKKNAFVYKFTKNQIGSDLSDYIDSITKFDDSGAVLPGTYLFFGQKSLDLSSIREKEKLLSLIEMELEFVDNNTDIIGIFVYE